MSYATLSAYGHSRLGEWILAGMTRELQQQVQSAAGCLTDAQSRDIAWDRSDLLCHAGCFVPGAHEIRV